MKRNVGEQTPFLRTKGRTVGFGSVMTVGLALLMVLAPAASAHPALTLTAPYGGTADQSISAGFTGCGGNASWSTSPSFNLVNGHAVTNTKATQVSCGSVSATTEAVSFVGLSSSTFSVASGHHSVKEKWSVTFFVDLVATPGPYPQFAYAESEVYIYTYVYDQTSSSYLSSSFHSSQGNSVSSGSLMKTFTSLRMEAFVNGTFTAGHTYYVVTELISLVDTSVSTGGSSASGSINMSTSGKHAVLSSITVS
ncbi:MAG: hypothetical protein L3K10_00465 [Thermoplasmata archaeon]|nr:hypothetical protein [Thermoplasmata archaeon]